MYGVNDCGTFRQDVSCGVGVAILAGDLAFSYVALESPLLLAIWPCMVRGVNLHREEGAIKDCDFAMHGANQSGTFLGPRVFNAFVA